MILSHVKRVTQRRAEGCLPHFFASASVPKVNLRRKRPNSSCTKPNNKPLFGLWFLTLKWWSWANEVCFVIGLLGLSLCSPLIDEFASISPNMPPRDRSNSLFTTTISGPYQALPFMYLVGGLSKIARQSRAKQRRQNVPIADCASFPNLKIELTSTVNIFIYI